MNIAQALKLKNSLVRRINAKKMVIIRENVKESKDLRKINVEKEMEELSKLVMDLVELKNKIAVANKDAYHRIYDLAESKSLITFLESLRGTCPINPKWYRQSGTATTEGEYDVTFDNQRIDVVISETQKGIEEQQDALDVYNANTQI